VKTDSILLMDGAEEIVSDLRELRFTISITASKPRGSAELQLQKFCREKERLICKDDFSKRNVQAELGLCLLERLDLCRKDIIYVGDMVFEFPVCSKLWISFRILWFLITITMNYRFCFSSFEISSMRNYT
jgi:hypothetical protein